MSLADFFDRIGTNFSNNLSDAGPQGLASLGAAIASAPRRQWGAGLAQGLGGMVQTAQAERKKRSLADALEGAMGGMNPQQAAFAKAVMQSDPSQAVGLIGQQLFTKPADKPNDIREYEFAKSQGFNGSFMDYQTALRRSGASSTTINNIPPEVGARTAMGEGFTADYDNIRDRVKKFYSGGPGQQVIRRGQMLFNTGEGGKLWADVETGKEALVRTLTGAGMAQAEAENQASRYGLSPYDTEFDALQKIERLYRDLNNVATGAFGAKGRKYTPPKSTAPKDHSDVDAILGIK